jgi:thiamine-monophosphate kinase
VSEQSRLELLRALFSKTTATGVVVGIGDDAAVLAAHEAPLVWTVDAAVEGVHFRRDWMTLEDIGWRSLAAAVSDLAAMGAAPRGVLSALILPDAFDDQDLLALARGQADAAAAFGTAVIGGNLARGRELSITTTALGEAERPILRSGAQSGDVLALAGAVGLAAAALEALQRTGPQLIGSQTHDVELALALSALRRPRARIADGLAAMGRARAGIDISDGLALDCSRLAAASGVGAVLDGGALLGAHGSVLATLAARFGRDPLDWALFGGDDYAILMAFPDASAVPGGFVPVGHCVQSQGLWLRAADGSTRPLEPRGFDHFTAKT